MDKETIIKGCENWVNNHEGENFLLTYSSVVELLAVLKEQETIFLRDGHHIRCTHCGEYWCDSDREGNPFLINFCPHCGRSVKWDD